MTQWRTLAIALLAAAGLASSIAHLTGASWLRTLAKASVASPLPRAFSQSQSLAGFSKAFTIELTGADGTVERRQASSALFAGLPGPYERQVIYAAALTYGPVHPVSVFATTLRYGFCRSGPLAERMGARQPVRSVALIGGPPRVSAAPDGADPARPAARARRIAVDCGPDAAPR